MNTINTNNAASKVQSYQRQDTKKPVEKQENKEVKTNQSEKQAVVYEKQKLHPAFASYDKNAKKLDPKTIDALKAEAEAQYAKMIETIKSMVVEQGENKGGISKELQDLMKLPASPAGSIGNLVNASKSKEQGLDPNYFSAEQTAERIVDFAKKISGGDIKKYEVLKGAIEKGFEAASSYFEKMPEITGQTKKLVMEKLDTWAGKIEKKPETEEKDRKVENVK